MRLSRKKPTVTTAPPPPAPTGFGRRTRVPPPLTETAGASKRRFFKRGATEPQARSSGHSGSVGVALLGLGIGALMLAGNKKRGA